MKNDTIATIFGFSTVIVIFVFSVMVGAVCWTYSINTWLIFFGHAATVRWWQGALLGLIPYFGQMSIPVAVFTWLLMLFLGGH